MSNEFEKSIRKPSPFSWTDDFTITDEEAEMIADPDWVFPNMLIQGHVAAFPAPPNGGKTTIFTWIAGQIARDYDVYYVNADISGGDAKAMQTLSKKLGFKLLLPDMKAGLSMLDVVKSLEIMNQQAHDLSSSVFIFDTLKKMTNVIHKDKASSLLKTLRGLSAKGMTIALLAHTNKYNDAEGKPIFEGVGDLRADSDEMIYLIPQKNPDGSMTVSTEPDKVRGKFSPVTFTISPDRQVSIADRYIDVANENRMRKQLEEDEPVIQAINEAIDSERFKQTEIIQHCKAIGVASKRSVLAVLKRYTRKPHQLWKQERGLQHNAIQYFRIDERTPFQLGKVTTEKTEQSVQTRAANG